MKIKHLFVLLLTCWGLGALPAQAGANPAPLPAAEIVQITLPGQGALGGDLPMTVLVYRPAGSGLFPVMVYAHGRAGDPAERARLQRPLGAEQLSFWLGQGVAVVAPVRPGYGDTGGPDIESSGAQFGGDGSCIRKPDFRRTVVAGRASTEATLSWVRRQPWADPRRLLLVGQSAGGFISMASSTGRPEGVLGAINFAGGVGGNPTLSPGRPCDADQLSALYGEFGLNHPVPTLWLYAANDQYWGADAPQAWFAAFSAGGSPARWVQAPPVADGDGHGLSRHARALWAPTVQAFLDTLPGWARHAEAAPAAASAGSAAGTAALPPTWPDPERATALPAPGQPGVPDAD